MNASLLGPNLKVNSAPLKLQGAKMKKLPDHELICTIVAHIIKGEVVGLARGRLEFGPRALGSRSILADARDPTMKDKLNQKIKLREGFRPFAPIVLIEDAPKYFTNCKESPYMLSTYQVTPKYRQKLPAITHIDGSARVQTVDKNRHPFLHKVLKEFKKHTGCSVLINTSYNVRGEPIVTTAEQAFHCFMDTDMDACVLDNYFLEKSKQDHSKYHHSKHKTTRKVQLD
jgi:carbamoyltransferase